MPTVEQVYRAIYESRFNDQSSAAAKAAAAAVEEYNASVDATVRTSERASRTTNTLINLNDGQTAAARRLITQTNILQQTQAAAAADAATGGARQEALARAIEGATSKVAASVAKLAALRGETSANASEIDNLRARYDPLYAAAQKSAAAQAEVNTLQRAGVLSAQGLKDALAQATEGYRSLAASAEQAARAAAAAAAAQGQGAANQFASRIDGLQVASKLPGDVSYAARAADIEAYGRALGDARAAIDPLYAASMRYEQALEAISAAQKQGVITAARAQALTAETTQAFAAANAPIDQHVQALQRVQKESGAAAASSRVMGIQVIQAVSGISTGQPVLTVLIQQGHQVADTALAMGASFKDVAAQAGAFFARIATSPIGITLAFGAALTVLVVSAENAANRLSSLRDTLRLTSDGYSGLATTVEATARKLSASSTLSFTDAFDVTKIIASAKYFAGTADELERLGRMAEGVGKIMGGSAAEGAKFLAAAITNPAAAAKELADKGLPSMNAELLRTVERLQGAGQGGEALKLVLGALGPAAAGAVKDVSPLKAALDDLANSLSGSKGGSQGLGVAIGTFLSGQVTQFLKDLRKGIEDSKNQTQEFWTWLNSLRPNRMGPAVREKAERDYDPTNFSQPLFGQNQPIVTRVTPAFRGPLLDAANRESLDPELLARLHLVEGALNSDGTWKTSPTGAIGPMQVTGTTFRGLQTQYPGDFGGQDVANPATNANASARLFSDLLTKYGDVKVAVLAYHDGEGVVDAMLAGRGEVSQAALAEANKVTSGYRGTGRAPSRADPGSFAGLDYVPPAQKGAGGGATAGAGAGAGPAVSAGVRNDARANQDELNGLVAGTNEIKRQDIAGELNKIGVQMEDLRKHGQQGSAEYAGLVQKQNELVASSNQLLTPQEKFLRGQQDQIAAGAGLYAGDQKLIELRQQMAQLERDQGGSFSAAQRADAESNALRQLSQEFNRTIAAQDLAIASNDNIAAAYGRGYEAVALATASQAAYSKSLADFPKGSAAQVAAQAKLTDEAIRTASSLQNLKLAQDTRANGDQLAYLQKEASLIGVSTEKREAELAVFKARQEAEKAGVPISEAALSANLRSVEALSRQSAVNKQLESSYTDLANIGVNAFTQVGDAIVEAFAQGSKKGIDFGDVMRGVIASVVKQLATLAVINPILNTLFGGNRSTLSSGLDVLFGSLKSGSVSLDSAVATAGNGTLNATEATFGYSGSSAGASIANAGSGTANGGIGAFSLISAAKTAYEAVTNIFTTGGSFLANAAGTLTSYAAAGITSIAGNALSATNAALAATTGAVPGVATAAEVAAASISQAAGASAATTAAAASAASTITAAIPYIGAAITLGTELLQGNWRGAAFVAAGAAIGTVILPGIGTAIGAAAGALVDAFFPQHAKNPFLNIDLNATGGQLGVGKVAAQIIDPTDTKKSLDDFATGLNTYMDAVSIKLANADGRVAQFGVNATAGKGTNADQGNLVNDIAGVFKALRFTAAVDDGSNLAIAKAGALPGQEFTGYEGLRDALVKIANFSDGLDFLGLQLKSVGNDLVNIKVDGLKASVLNSGQPLTDFQTAVQHDLPGKNFATLDDFQAEITKIANFIGSTMPSLLNPVIDTTTSLQKSIQDLVKTYADAIATAQSYGLATDGLVAAQAKGIQLLQAPAIQALSLSNLQILMRGQTARGQNTQQSQLQAFDIQADQQRTQLADAFKNVWGSLIPPAKEYGAAVKVLDETLAAERVGLVKQTNQAILDTEKQAADALIQAARGAQDANLAVFGQFISIRARQKAASGDERGAEIDTYNLKAIDETKNYDRQLADFYGASFRATKDYANRMKELETVQGAERLAIAKKYGGQLTQAAAQAYAQARGSVLQVIGSLADYSRTLASSAASPLAPQAQYSLALRDFRAVSGAAAAGDFKSLQKLQGYSDTLLTASRAVNGSGMAYADDYKAVLAALQSAATAPVDKLTDSAMKQATEEQTRALSGKLDELKAELVSVRRELQQQSRAKAA